MDLQDAPLFTGLTHPPLMRQGEKLLIACSGGPDSRILAHALHSLAPAHRWILLAGHVDHSLRSASEGEANAVERQLAPLGIPLLRRKVDIPARQTLGEGLETAARALRYQALIEMAQEAGATAIATAHHANDQLETILMRLTRGSVAGLRGMPRVRYLSENLRLVRPLLSVPRSMIMEYLERHGLDYLEDPTNFELGTIRNRLRAKVVPELLALNPSLLNTLPLRLDALEDEHNYLQARAREALESLTSFSFPGVLQWQRPGFLALDVALQRRALALACPQVGLPAGELTSRRLEALRERILTGRGACEIACGVRAHVQADRVWLWGPAVPMAEPAVPDAPAGAWGWALVRGPADPHVDVAFAEEAWGEGWQWRAAEPGDVFQPWGRSGPMPLDRFLAKARIPAPLRARWPVLARGPEIAWVVGLRRGPLAPLEPGTMRALRAVRPHRAWFDNAWSAPYHDETMLGGADPLE